MCASFDLQAGDLQRACSATGCITNGDSHISDSPSRSLDASAAEASRKQGSGRLLKVLGVWFGIAAAVGNTIAAGVVRAPGDIAQQLPQVLPFFAVWIIGGLYALFGASSLAELS